LKKGREYILKDVCSLIFVESSTKRDGIYETLVTPYQFLPGKLIAASAGQYQLQVTIFHFVSLIKPQKGTKSTKEFTEDAVIPLCFLCLFVANLFFSLRYNGC
jgi:hypothetical protein